MHKILKNLIIIFITITSIFAMAHFAFALDTGTGYAASIGLGDTDPRDVIINIIKVVLTFLGIVAVGIILYGGFLWMTAGGNADQIDKAKKTLIAAVVGLIIILSAWAITAFIINKMSDVTSSGPVCDPPCVGTCCPDNLCCGVGDACCGGGCCPSSSFCCDGFCQATPCSLPAAFMVKAIQPSEVFCPIDNNTTIRNAVIRIYFNKTVDSDSVNADSIVIKDSNLQCPAGTLNSVVGDFTVNGKVVEFRPSAGTCPANDCDADRCFGENSTIDIEVMTSGMNRVTTDSGSEQVQDNLIINENPKFFTNDLIDCANPIVSLNSDPQVCLGYANDLGAISSDDSGVSQVEFSDSNGNSAFGGAPVVEPCAGPGSCGQSPDNWILPLGTAVWLPTSPVYNSGVNYTITVVANDLDDNVDSDNKTFTLRPAHCCNNEFDNIGDEDLLLGDSPEEGVDCGGDCAACSGAACGISFAETCAGDPDSNCDDTRCASGFCHCGNYIDGPLPDDSCQEKGYDDIVGDNCCVCENKPIIDWISPIGGFCDGSINTSCQSDADCSVFTPNTCNTDTPNGAVGNFVTIGGRNFNDAGAVYFSDAGGNPVIEALFPNSVNPDCDDTWTNNQIIVVVPAGASEGPIKVVEATTGNNYEDTTDNNFIINTIKRPGMCKLENAEIDSGCFGSDCGVMNDSIHYYGINFSSANTVNFGNYLPGQYTEALDFNYIDNKNIKADVPNIQTGKTTSFILNGAINSNYLEFTKNAEPVSGPYITSFEATQGSTGQYVTIYGSGFGNSKGASKVYFDLDTTPDSGNDAEADYSFPEVCADSVWKDNQIIVKVPDLSLISDPNNYYILIDLQDWADLIDTSDLAPNKFNFDSSLPLAPSLCKIQPVMGPNNSPISLWGEYFGDQATGLVRFHLNNDQSGAAIIFWGVESDADKVETTVHQNAVSGPVKIVQSGSEGNSLDFVVGLCTKAADPDAACGSDICCPAGSTEEGICHATVDDCYVSITASVYEWDFSTTGPTDVGDPCYVDFVTTPSCSPTFPACTAPQFCDPASCSCQLPFVESCMGFGAGECADNFCPNSPGNCSFYDGSGAVAIVDCDDDECASRFGAGYTYNSNLNKCVDGSVCDLSTSALDGLGNPATAYCAEYNSAGRWHIDTSVSCPDDWSNIGGNKCVEDGTTCVYCNSEFSCLDDSGSGVCAVDQEICPVGSSCVAGQCEGADSPFCECCCRIGYSAQDCCYPLDCAGDCGFDRVDDNDEFGYCTGCALAGTTQAEHDLACNCFGSSGKYCDSSDADYPDGICRDCSQLSTTGECSSHSASCCIDNKQGDICKGGDGTLVAIDPGYCAYYNCQPEPNEDQCDIVTPIINGSYSDVDSCSTECGANGPIGGLSCYNNETDLCDIICGSGYTCLGDSGCEDNLALPAGCGSGDASCLCCCDPDNDQCSLINSSLTCTTDQDPCDGNERGLCCGCAQDDECGDSNVIGCGFDGCCRSRPEVVERYPLDEDDAGYAPIVCRNTIIQATFDQEMDISSFSGKVIVVGDYGNDLCPEGTQFLTKHNDKNRIASIFNKIKLFVKQIINPISYLAKAYTSPVPADHNYCAVTGMVSGYNNAANKGVLTFSPSQLLDAGRKYYVIIKGDSNITDNVSEGVLNNYDIGMNGANTETFNARTYVNAHIWFFEVGALAEVCELDYVFVDPPSYLFTTADDTQAFMAQAETAGGYGIVGIAGVYDWSWGWSSDNTGVAVVTNSDNPLQIVTSQNVEDAKTFVRAKATIIEDTINNTVGQTKEGKASVYVFLCENPWPPINANGIWYPWGDNYVCDDGSGFCPPGASLGDSCNGGAGNCAWNCTIPDAGCFDTKYEVYYCRDTGGIGTADDYKAILSGTGDSVIRGSSTSQDLLKEVYYLRENIPDATDNFVAENNSDAMAGGSVNASWNIVIGADGYKIYYGTSAGSYDEFITIDDATQNSWTINDLENDTIYYFNLTSYDDTGAESEYVGDDVEVFVKDAVAPEAPTELTTVAGDEQIDLSWTASDSADTIGYKVYYGTSPGVYGDAQDVGDVSGAFITGLTNGQIYYFAVTAYDGYDNESEYSNEVSSTPVAP